MTVVCTGKLSGSFTQGDIERNLEIVGRLLAKELNERIGAPPRENHVVSVCAGSAGEADDKHAAPALQASHNFTLQPILMFIL